MINNIYINKKKFVLKKFEDLCDDESNFALKIRNHPDVRSQMYNSNVIDKNELLKLLNSEVNSCKNVDFRILGLSLATINFLLSFLIFVLILKVIKNEKNK